MKKNKARQHQEMKQNTPTTLNNQETGIQTNRIKNNKDRQRKTQQQENITNTKGHTT